MPRLLTMVALAALLGSAAVWRWDVISPAAANRSATTAGSGMRIELDDAGRPVVPEPADATAHDQSADDPRAALQLRAPLRIEAAPGGGEMVRLDGLIEHHSRVVRQAGDRLGVTCAESPP